jgi:suppressor of fused protein SUFU
MEIENDPDVLLVRKHLVEHLGRPDEVFEVRGSPLANSPLQVLHLAYFAPGGTEAPVVFATCGASLFQMKDGRRVEGIMLLRAAPSPEAVIAIHRMLSSFAIFAEANDETVRVGDVVRAPENLHQFSHMDAVLFLPPVPFVESFHKILIRNDQSVDVIWLLPVYESEAQYALKHGPQALMLLFAAQGLDLTEMERDEANTLIEPEDARQLAQKRAEEERKKGDQKTPARPKVLGRKPPTSTGSYQVQDDANAVTVVRRGTKEKAKPKPDLSEGSDPPKRHLEIVPPPPPEQEPKRATSSQRHPVVGKSKRPILGLAPVKPEKVIKFDLTASQAPGQPGAPSQRKPITPQKQAPATRQVETAEQKAEAKRKKIEELKQKAQDAAKRAAERQQAGRAPPPPDESADD